jgi:fengycin family lipopeptide synthetase D/gramicidin S synthase 2/tyrocidine synthetase-2
MKFIAHFPDDSVTGTDDTLGELVAAAARREGVTLLVYFLTGLAELLHAETGQTDIALQTSLNVRPLLGAESLIGGFNSPIIVRFDLSKRTCHRELLLRTRDAFSQAYEHALISPAQIVPAYAGRMNVGFAGSDDVLQLGNVIGTYTRVVSSNSIGGIPVDLRPTLVLEGPRLVVYLDYITRLFRRDTVERLCARYFAILRAMAHDPQATLTA